MAAKNSRCWIFAVTIAIGLAAPTVVRAQLLLKVGRALDRIPDPLGLPGDLVRARLDEQRLGSTEARLQQDAARGDADAVARDLRRISYNRWLLEHDRWSVRRDSLQPVGPNPLWTTSPAAVGTPPASPRPAATVPAPAAAKVSINIVKAGPAGSVLPFSIDGLGHAVAAGRPVTLEVSPTSVVTYDRGGSLGPQSYSLAPGAYVFRPRGEGWAFYRLAPR